MVHLSLSNTDLALNGRSYDTRSNQYNFYCFQLSYPTLLIATASIISLLCFRYIFVAVASQTEFVVARV